MKNISLLFLAISALVISSCSTDDIAPYNNENANIKVLKKTIKYAPSEQNYESKQIVHYNMNGEIVADSTFDATSNLISYIVRSSVGMTKYRKTYNAQNILTFTDVYIYDNLDRLIETSGSRNATFVYNPDNSISQFSETYNDVLIKFTVNANGVLNSMHEFIPNYTKFLEYEGLVPTKYLFDFGGVYECEYYSNPMPSNLIKSPTQLNNLALSSTALEHIPMGGNYYLKDFGGFWKYEIEFDSLNYMTYSKSINVDDNQQEHSSSEKYFYYY
ncbi:MAG: hypothetical protein ACOH1O_07720 [Flavobacterium sp.]